jgi:hypothetical protein
MTLVLSKDEMMEKLSAKLYQLPEEELIFLYNSEFASKFDEFKVLKIQGQTITKPATGELVKKEVVIRAMTKFFEKENKNHALVMIYNSVVVSGKAKYLGDLKFELSANG